MSRTPKKLYAELASIVVARQNCRKNGNEQWLEAHGKSLDFLLSLLPSGSGIDNGVDIDEDSSNDNRLVFNFGFHHMNDSGMYSGWTHHSLIVTGSLMSGFDMKITGRNRNDIKDYLHDTFHYALSCEVWQTEDGAWHSTLYGEKFVPSEQTT